MKPTGVVVCNGIFLGTPTPTLPRALQGERPGEGEEAPAPVRPKAGAQGWAAEQGVTPRCMSLALAPASAIAVVWHTPARVGLEYMVKVAVVTSWFHNGATNPVWPLCVVWHGRQMVPSSQPLVLKS